MAERQASNGRSVAESGYEAIAPLPERCPDCGRSDVRWRFEGARTLTDPPFLKAAAWVHREGMQVHSVVWTEDQVLAARRIHDGSSARRT